MKPAAAPLITPLQLAEISDLMDARDTRAYAKAQCGAQAKLDDGSMTASEAAAFIALLRRCPRRCGLIVDAPDTAYVCVAAAAHAGDHVLVDACALL